MTNMPELCTVYSVTTTLRYCIGFPWQRHPEYYIVQDELLLERSPEDQRPANIWAVVDYESHFSAMGQSFWNGGSTSTTVEQEIN